MELARSLQDQSNHNGTRQRLESSSSTALPFEPSSRQASDDECSDAAAGKEYQKDETEKTQDSSSFEKMCDEAALESPQDNLSVLRCASPLGTVTPLTAA